MNKRLSRSDYLFSLIFIFMLIAVVGAFFYGLKIGEDRAAASYEKLHQTKEVPKQPTAYQQQQLVSFYHTIYLPYHDFQKKWFEHINSIELDHASVDRKSLLKELDKLAKEKYDKLIAMSMPEVSPLLRNAHSDYLKSLKLFSEASKKMAKQANELSSGKLMSAIKQDAFFQEAESFALAAQSNYYAAIVKWNETVNPNMEHIQLLKEKNLSLNQWNQLNFNLKNAVIASILTAEKYYEPYTPQDMTARIDEMSANGQIKKMNLNKIVETVEMLANTGAVRRGDYLRSKQFYEDETVPQLPFFFE